MIPTGSPASRARRRCWRRSIIRTSPRIYGVEDRAIVMELVEGETLPPVRCRRKKRCP